MPNRLVFPGGAVDEADFTATAATPLSAEARAGLERAASPALASALAHAAARELEEESGLHLGHPPALDGLAYLCRAITPALLPIRFDARFLVVDASRVAGVLGGSGELEDIAYVPIEAALAGPLQRVTRGVLGHLRRWLDAPGALRPTTPLCVEQVWGEE